MYAQRDKHTPGRTYIA